MQSRLAGCIAGAAGHDPRMPSRPAPSSLAAALFAACAGSPAVDEATELRWACDVLLGREVGDARDGVVRWRQPVRYLVVGADGAARRAVAAAVGELRAALGELQTIELEHVRADDPRVGQDGFVSVFFVAPRAAGDLAARFGLSPAADADGWFRLDWNGAYELVRAVVLIAPDLDDRWLRHTSLEELFQVLGPCNDSALRDDSVVFEGPQGAGSAGALSARDRRLLALLYRDLEPGDAAAHVARALRGARR